MATSEQQSGDGVRWIYGYGRTKHLTDGTYQLLSAGRRGDPVALCGVYGGHPFDEPNRPACKRCLVRAQKLDLTPPEAPA